MNEIKPLKWSKQEPNNLSLDGDDRGSLWALSVGGYFEITKTAMLWMADDPFVWKQFKSVAAAKFEAQSIHEKNIRAMLASASSTDPSQETERL